MQKFAHLVKTAEVRGVLAYLVDNGLIEVESEEDFDALVQEVTAALGEEEYDLDTVLNKTSEILEAAKQQGGEKQAESQDQEEKTAEELEREVGQLTMSKMAGEISDEEYQEKVANMKARIANAVSDAAAQGKGYLSQAGSKARRGADAASETAASTANRGKEVAEDAVDQAAKGARSAGNKAQAGAETAGQAARSGYRKLPQGTVAGTAAGGGAGLLARMKGKKEE